jgi:flagellar hook-associated protein 2
LRNLERNYQEIIDNIEKKITREDERLARWERMMINKFARLDAVLARYNGMNESLQVQIAQLGNLNSNRK